MLEHGIDLVDAKVLLFANSVFKRSEELSEALLYEGPISLPKLRIDVGPDQLVDSLSTIDATNVIDGLYLNVQLTSLIMDVLAEARSESEKIKILSRFQLLDKVNSKIVVHLFKQVNKCIKSAATRESYDIPFKIDKVLRNIGLSRVLREVNQLIKSAEAQSSQDSKSSTKE